MVTVTTTHHQPGTHVLSAPLAAPRHYVSIPDRLTTDLRNNPLAIGLYSLIGRLYFSLQEPVPLSTSDITLFDPSLNRGAILRALTRLTQGGWLIELSRVGGKSCYTPTWGKVRGISHPWEMDKPRLNRPQHIHAERLDRRLLDTCMGRLTPHQVHAALVDRYFSKPILSLSDLGSYALALAGFPATTPQLTHLGLIHNACPKELPNDTVLIAMASQAALENPAAATITPKGLSKLGIAYRVQQPDLADSSGQPLLYVPPDMIGGVIGGMIGGMIGSPSIPNQDIMALQSPEEPSPSQSKTITGSQIKQGNLGTPPQAPQLQQTGGGMLSKIITDQENPKTAASQEPDSSSDCEENNNQTLDNATAQALRTINVWPQVVAELASQPLALVEATIAAGRSQLGVRNLAGWVVARLRAARDHGWYPEQSTQQSLPGIVDCGAPEEHTTTAVEPVDTPEYPASPAEQEPTDLTSLLRIELRARCARPLWGLIEGLQVTQSDGILRLHCQTPAELPLAKSHIMPLVGPVLRALGWNELPHIRVLPSPSLLSVEDSPPKAPSPDWIAADRWVTLPLMLRAALIGSTLQQGVVQGATPMTNRLLVNHYQAEVAALLSLQAQ